MDKSMTLFAICTLLFFLAEKVRADDAQCPDKSTKMKELKKVLFCSYDRYERPVQRQSDTVNMKFRMVLKKIQFDEIKDTVDVNSLFVMTWTDYNLKWEPSQYDNIQEIRVGSYQIWTPDIGVFSSAEQTAFTSFLRPTICMVYYTGHVWCSPLSSHTTSCAADITRWPYDRHTCYLVFGSWTHAGEMVNISVLYQSVYLEEYNMNREWELISMDSSRQDGRYPCCPNETYPTVTFTIVLQRHSGSYVAIAVVPAVVLMLMTLLTWMKSDQSDRVILATIDVFLHVLFLQYLGNILPSNGESTPLIVTFYRDSMFLTTLALFIPIITRGLKKTSISPPVWISSLSSWASQNRFGRILIFQLSNPKGMAAASGTAGEEGINLVESDGSQSHGWHIISSLLNLTCFIVTLVTYITLVIGFIP